ADTFHAIAQRRIRLPLLSVVELQIGRLVTTVLLGCMFICFAGVLHRALRMARYNDYQRKSDRDRDRWLDWKVGHGLFSADLEMNQLSRE
ncbi:MAG: hypothetical protein KDI22_04715, partial [Gammaproteobacteria bacterium]|nr:hypothetical protein [Gammaproteobacteria bacterium]